MAIDSRDKRASALNTEMPWDWPSFVPDGTMTLADRQDSQNSYRGILAGIMAISKLFKDWWWTT